MLGFGRDCSYSLTHRTSIFSVFDSFIVCLPNYDIQTFVEVEYYGSFSCRDCYICWGYTFYSGKVK